MQIWKSTLRRKLTLIIMLTCATVLIVAFIADSIYDYIETRELLVQHTSMLSEMLASSSTAALAFGDEKAAAEILHALRANPAIAAACTYNQKGEPFAQYVRLPATSRFKPPPVRGDGDYLESGMVMHFRKVTLGSETLGFILVESDLQKEMRARIPGYLFIISLFLTISILIAYLLASRLQKVISGPVLALVETTHQISVRNDYSFRAVHYTDDELGMLVDGFNGMLDQIQRRDHELESRQVELQKEVEMRTVMNKQLELAKEMAEAANRAKGEFLANMSHEIRTPINGVLGMTELALATDLNPEQRDYLQMVKSSGESLLSVINDILDFSKVESGRIELEHIDFNLYSFVGETMKVLALRAHQKNLELVYDVSPDVPAQVLGDPSRLRQVLVNLVGNAIKFTEHGEVVLEVDCRSLSEHGVELHFRVTDTGIGIPPEKHHLLFQAFSQADSSTTRKYGGSGLGLAISARLAETMQGRIWVESQAGKGSTFHFTARFELSNSDFSLLSPASPAELKGVPVLIVDDNDTNRRVLSETVRSWGMRPTLATSGHAALAAVEEAQQKGNPFRVILTDACMPSMDGFELAQKIQNEPRLGIPTILMLTSAGQPGEASRCRQLGIAAYLLKPVLRDDLQAAVLAVLGYRRAETAATPPLVTRHSLREAPRKLRILVVEDNAVNQTLVVRVLEKMGHTSVVALNGKEALSLATTQHFDLIFMDIQMPEMDGLAATRAIREYERPRDLHVPIHAMTAHAMKGDRERCLEAGMDGYVPKPVRFSDIEEILSSVAEESADNARPAWGKEEALARLEGDEGLLQELCQIFLRESPNLVERIRNAILESDSRRAERAAHSLRGELSYLCAPGAVRTAERLEEMARGNDLSRAAETLSTLEQQLAALRLAMQEPAEAH